MKSERWTVKTACDVRSVSGAGGKFVDRLGPWVSFLNGEIVPETVAAKTLSSLAVLWGNDDVVPSNRALFELSEKARNPKTEIVDSLGLLKEYGLIKEDGGIDPHVAVVVRNSFYCDKAGSQLTFLGNTTFKVAEPKARL